MALTYVGGTSGGGTGASYTVSLNGTLTGGSGSSPQAGDLILVFCGETNSGAVTPTCSGNTYGAYPTNGTVQNQADTGDANLAKWYAFAGSTPDTTLTITRGSNNTTHGSATVVQVWRGADPTNPFNVTQVQVGASNSSAANPGAITPTTAGSVIVWCGHASQVAASGTAFTAAGTYPITTKNDGSTYDSIIMVAAKTDWTTGAFDPAAFTGSTTTTALAWEAVTIVIQPVAVVDYPLTCNSGSYTYTGSSADITYVGKKPILISTALWQQDTLGTAGNPGAKSITVPSDAQAVVVQFHCGATSSSALSITSDFASTFTVIDSGNQNQCSLGYALVTSTGAKNLTLSWTQGLVEGPSVYISFIKNINTSDWVREVAVVGTNTSGTSATNVFDTSTDDLLLVVNDQDSGGAPTTISGFTSIATTGDTYNNPSRLQSCDSPGATTTTVTGTTTNFDVLSGISIKPNTTGAYTLTANAGSYTHTGSSATITRNRALTSNAGSYTYTGSSADITKGAALNHRSLTANAGSYSEAGSTATILKGRHLIHTAGSYSYAGTAAVVLRSKSVTSTAGSYSYAGNTASVVRGRRLVQSAGSYSYAGNTAAVVRGRALVHTAGSYSYAGTASTIRKNRALTNSAGSYSYAGTTATITKAVVYAVTALSGSYSQSGSTATIRKNRALTSSAGSYSYAGSTAVVFRGRPLTALAGSYTSSGQSLPVWRGRALTTQLGGYSLAGNTAVVTKGAAAQSYSLTALAGSYAKTGQSAGILRGRALVASSGPYAYTGQATDIRRGRSLVSTAGAYAYLGQSVVVAHDTSSSGYSLTALVGTYGLTGQNTTISRSRAMLLNSGGYAVSGGIAGIFAGAVQRPPGRAISVMVDSFQIVSLVTTKVVAVRPSAVTIPLFISSDTAFVRPTDSVIFTK